MVVISTIILKCQAYAWIYNLLSVPLTALPPQDSAMGEGRDVWEHGPPPRKMRRMEWVSSVEAAELGDQ